jgi:hypothetical protein
MNTEQGFGGDVAHRRRVPTRRREPRTPLQHALAFVRSWFFPFLGLVLCILVVRNWVWLVEVAQELKEWEADMRR